MWRALETEIGPREEVMAASALLGELIGPADEEAEAEMRRLLATRYTNPPEDIAAGYIEDL